MDRYIRTLPVLCLIDIFLGAVIIFYQYFPAPQGYLHPSPQVIMPYISSYRITPTPAVITQISSEDIIAAVNSYRASQGLSIVAIRDPLCNLSKDILSALRVSWHSREFSSYAKGFYSRYPEFTKLSVQAAEGYFSADQIMNRWLEDQKFKADLSLSDINSICVITDQSLIVQIIGTHKVAKISAPPSPTPDTAPWGVARQISDHTWTFRVGSDAVMGTPEEIFSALNTYRRRYGSPVLTWDPVLARYAGQRADYINILQKSDDHAGFNDFLVNQDGFRKLGFNSLGENIFYGNKLSAVHIIEWVYAADEAHNKNQLDTRWAYVGIGTSGLGNAVIFGTGRY